MRNRRTADRARRVREFEAFVAGAAGRLLHAAALLTAEPLECSPAAQRLLTAALSETFADWDRLRGDDPYDHARQQLATRFARRAGRHRRSRGGPLGRLAPQQRLVVMLLVYEEVAEEQAAAALGLPEERVRTLCTRAVSTLRSRPAELSEPNLRNPSSPAAERAPRQPADGATRADGRAPAAGRSLGAPV